MTDMRRSKSAYSQYLVSRAARALAMAAALATVPAVANATVARSQDPFSSFTPLSNATLADLRGGMFFGHMKFDFAVTISTEVNKMIDTTMGEVTKNFGLTTMLKFNSQGDVASTSNTVTGTPDTVTVPTTGQSGPIEASVGDAGTEVIHRIGQDQLSSITKNISDATNIVQSGQVDLTAKNFQQLSHTFAITKFASQVGRTSGLSALGH